LFPGSAPTQPTARTAYNRAAAYRRAPTTPAGCATRNSCERRLAACAAVRSPPTSSGPYATRAPGPNPGVFTSSVLSELPGVRYNIRKSGPPKARFRTTSGVRITPITSPDGAITQMPPEPTQNTRPAVSTLRPSGTPGSAEDISQNIRLLLR